MKRRGLSAMALFLLCSPPLIAEEIYFGARADRLTPAAGGYGIETGYLWSASPALQAELGVAHHDVADSHWSYLVAGGVVRMAQNRDVVSVRMEAGQGQTGQQIFNHRVVKLSLFHAFSPGRFIGDLGLDRIEVGTVRETLLRAGAQVYMGRGYFAQAHRHERISGQGSASSWSARLDKTIPSGSWFVGAVRGQATIDALTAVTGSTQTQETDEFFGGLSRPFERNIATLTFNRIEQPHSRRTSLAILWRRRLQ